MTKPRLHKLLAAANAKTETLRVAVPVNVLFAAAESGQPEGPGTFDAVLYSGGPLDTPVQGPKYGVPIYVDLATAKIEENILANLDHDEKQRVGHGTVDSDGKRLTARGSLSAKTEYRDQVRDSAKDKYPWRVSMEAEYPPPTILAANRTAKVNGRNVTGPAVIIRGARVYGLAFVSRGADSANSVTIAAGAATKGISMDPFEKWLTDECGFDPTTLTPQQTATLKASFDARQSQHRLPTPSIDRTTEDDPLGLGMHRLQAQNVEQLKLLAARFLDAGEADFATIDKLGKQAIAESWTPAQFELSVLRAMRQPAQPRFASGRDARTDERVLAAALAVSAGLPDVDKHYDEETLDQVDRLKFRNIGIQQVLLAAAVSNGYTGHPGERIHPGNIEEILDYAMPPRHAQLRASTISLPGIFGNVGNKELVAGVSEIPQPWKECFPVKPVNNFYQRTCYSLLDDMEFQDLTNQGEIKHGRLGQDSYTRQAKTRAIMLHMSREDIINDDVGIVDELRTRVGRGSVAKLNRLIWTTWLDDAAFFPTADTYGNYLAHANSTLLTDGVGLAMGVDKFRKMRTSAADGRKSIAGPPVILLVPPELALTAEKFYVSQNLVGGSSTIPAANVFANKFKPVEVPELSDSNYAGSSTTAWYLLRSPQIAPGLVVSALGGRTEPVVETVAPASNKLGIDFRGYADVGADKAEKYCGIKSKGAAP